jgi:BirA family biotin operon repressor/biotin-[acetyl-CoA-carboxylase] ligase
MQSAKTRTPLTRPYIDSFVYLEQVDSTNTYTKTLLEKMPAVGDKITVVVAGRQTAGRGRQERTFFSSVNGGLWVSLIVGIKSLDSHFSVNRALSLAICETIQLTAAVDARIKWPNDIYCNNRKICGILLETAGQRSDAIVAGFGLNVNISQQDFPSGLLCIATSLMMEAGEEFDLRSILEKILDSFEKIRTADMHSAHSQYTKILYRSGSLIEINGNRGIFEGVETDGRLRLRTAQSLKFMTSGTVRFIEK